MRVIVFSKDRACQLDLLLRSLKLHAPRLASDVRVLMCASAPEFEQGYDVCVAEHPATQFYPERDFRADVLDLLRGDEQVMFLTDDSLFYRALEDPDAIGEALERDEILCVSLRLGRNTTYCYPLDQLQQVPLLPFHSPGGDVHSRLLAWDWRRAEADFSYPGSVDGHVFRRTDVQRWLLERRPFANPNELEETLCAGCADEQRRLMACYAESVLVGVPLNRVQNHHPNRCRDSNARSAEQLNRVYLAGGRLSLDVDPALVNGAHTELTLRFE